MEKVIKGIPDGWMNVVRREEPIRRERVDEKREAPPQLLYTTNELAAVLGVKVLTIRRWTKAGIIPIGLDIGGAKRWRRGEIESWILAGSPPHEIWKDMPSQK